MKRFFLRSMIGCLMIMLGMGCEEESEQRDLTIAPISDLRYEVSNGEILFTWVNPKIPNIAYVEISYQDVEGNIRRSLAQSGETSYRVSGISNNDQHDYSFVVYNKDGYASDPVTTRVASREPLVNLFFAKVNAAVNFGGIAVSWDNIYDAEFYVNVMYEDLNANINREEIVIPSYSDGRQLVKIGEDLQGTQTVNVIIQASDVNGNVSGVREMEFFKKEAGRFDRTNWKVFDISSEQGGSEVMKLFDGNSGTNWHSRWSSNKLDFPHYFTIDLGSKKYIEKVSSQHPKDRRMAYKFELYGTNISGEVEEDDWAFCGSFVLEDNNNEQIFNLQNGVEYRYVKVVFTEPNVASHDKMCVSVAELNLFGQDIDQ